jgi:tRNA pseudouridine55 synthase
VLKPRPITVFRFDIISYNYPELVLDIECSGGTYVRSLGRDLAEAVGTSAVMSALVRTAIGSFKQSEACQLGDLSTSTLQRWLHPLEVAVMRLHRVDLTPVEAESVRFGRFIARAESFVPRTECAAFNENGMLVAILMPRGDGRLQPAKNLL